MGETGHAGRKPAPAIVGADRLGELVGLLRERGYRVVAPAISSGAVAYEEIEDASALPWGWTDRQEAGTYRLERRADNAAFGYAVGPHSWKRYLFPPERLVWRGTVEDDGRFDVKRPADEPAPTAFLGVRACEIAAIRIQDRVFLDGPYVDEAYRRRREAAVVIAVNCTSAAATCFCASMDTGPGVESGYDLALTELVDADRHDLLVEVGSDLGAELAAALDLQPAADVDLERARRAVEATAASMTRQLDTRDVREVLLGNLDHPNWDEIATRCLACGNCTLVCPTCFCSTVADASDLTGKQVERRQVWDSCFTADHSYLHGGSVHGSIRTRYRQWLTHKLATWIDQFGTSGCVGCGRCITWCPVGIDLTEELPKFRNHEPGAPETAPTARADPGPTSLDPTSP